MSSSGLQDAQESEGGIWGASVLESPLLVPPDWAVMSTATS